ncbi:MAG: hypothetical protein M3081_12280, partial [Gemmatimonadota bacterium]|nr:hypothetical protein [Gemmatimonadota bacterium]
MRLTQLAVLLLATSFAACQSTQTVVVGTGEVMSPGTNIYGEWTLAMNPDSTGFLGARTVDLTLQPGTFTIVAKYPGGE